MILDIMKIYLVDLVKKNDENNNKDNDERPIEIPEVGTVTIGRGKLSDIVIGAEEENVCASSDSEGLKYLECVSKNHCTLYVDGSQPYVKDNDSKNGTFINGERVESSLGTLLNHGDILSLGPYGFQVFFHDRDSRIGVKQLGYSLSETVPYEPEDLNGGKGERQ